MGVRGEEGNYLTCVLKIYLAALKKTDFNQATEWVLGQHRQVRSLLP